MTCGWFWNIFALKSKYVDVVLENPPVVVDVSFEHPPFSEDFQLPRLMTGGGTPGGTPNFSTIGPWFPLGMVRPAAGGGVVDFSSFQRLVNEPFPQFASAKIREINL